MTQEARRELALAMADRYRRASRERKGVMLHEFCAATGCHRKYAIEMLRRPLGKPIRRKSGGRPGATAMPS